MDNKFSDNVELTIKDFQYKNGEYFVKNNGKNGLLVIYAPWCGYCNLLVPEWKKLVKEYGDKYFIKALNADNVKNGNKKITEGLEVEGFPTIRYINESGKISKENYSEERSIKNFVNYLSKK